MRRLRLAATAAIFFFGVAEFATAADDGKRTVDVPRFGVRVRVPQAWNLIDWSRDDKAFVLQLPQDRGSQAGFVGCRLAVTAGKLDDFQRRFAEAAANEPAPPVPPPTVPSDPQAKPITYRRLTKNAVEPTGAASLSPELRERFGGRRLVAEWACEDSRQRRWFERRVLLVGGGMLYDFSLDSDEAHYDAYAADFEEMLATLKLSPLQLPVVAAAAGYWMQRDFRFGLKPADGWNPSFGPSDRVLFYAVGATHDSFTDHVTVAATQARPLDLEKLRAEAPEEMKRRDPQAAVECRIVAQRIGPALETLVRTKRGERDVVILERRFAGKARNYEVRLTCDADEFKRREADLRAMLDSFVELPPTENVQSET